MARDLVVDRKVIYFEPKMRCAAEHAREMVAGCARAWAYKRRATRDASYHKTLVLMHSAIALTGHSRLSIWELLARDCYRVRYTRYLLGACVEALLHTGRAAFQSRRLLAGSLFVALDLTAADARFLAQEAVVYGLKGPPDPLSWGRQAMQLLIETGNWSDWPCHDLDELIVTSVEGPPTDNIRA